MTYRLTIYFWETEKHEIVFAKLVISKIHFKAYSFIFCAIICAWVNIWREYWAFSPVTLLNISYFIQFNKAKISPLGNKKQFIQAVHHDCSN